MNVQLSFREERSRDEVTNAANAVVEREKITGYLLNPSHRFGASKARFFGPFGFGPRYEVEGTLSAPDGRHPRVRTVWQVDRGEVAPRLITAYPTEERHD